MLRKKKSRSLTTCTFVLIQHFKVCFNTQLTVMIVHPFLGRVLSLINVIMDVFIFDKNVIKQVLTEGK